MIAEYNKWYRCKEGQMPEDFENIYKHFDKDHTNIHYTERVEVYTPELFDKNIYPDCRYKDYSNKNNVWKWVTFKEVVVIKWRLIK